MARPLTEEENEVLKECIINSSLPFRAKRNFLQQVSHLMVEQKFYSEEDKGRAIFFEGYKEAKTIKACSGYNKRRKKIVIEADIVSLRIVSFSVKGNDRLESVV